MEVIALAIAFYPASGQAMGHQHLQYCLNKVSANKIKTNEETDATYATLAKQLPSVATQSTSENACFSHASLSPYVRDRQD